MVLSIVRWEYFTKSLFDVILFINDIETINMARKMIKDQPNCPLSFNRSAFLNNLKSYGYKRSSFTPEMRVRILHPVVFHPDEITKDFCWAHIRADGFSSINPFSFLVIASIVAILIVGNSYETAFKHYFQTRKTFQIQKGNKCGTLITMRGRVTSYVDAEVASSETEKAQLSKVQWVITAENL